ncbi:hypothetical protein [Bradyrhizobium sp. USDA 4452]
MTRSKVLVPFMKEEAISIADAAARTGMSERTIRNWCHDFGIGAQLARGREWQVSIVALTMLFFYRDREALKEYERNGRKGERVLAYFAMLGIAADGDGQAKR